jgi:hypothetical protein
LGRLLYGQRLRRATERASAAVRLDEAGELLALAARCGRRPISENGRATASRVALIEHIALLLAQRRLLRTSL